MWTYPTWTYRRPGVLWEFFSTQSRFGKWGNFFRGVLLFVSWRVQTEFWSKKQVQEEINFADIWNLPGGTGWGRKASWVLSFGSDNFCRFFSKARALIPLGNFLYKRPPLWLYLDAFCRWWWTSLAPGVAPWKKDDRQFPNRRVAKYPEDEFDIFWDTTCLQKTRLIMRVDGSKILAKQLGCIMRCE